MPKEFDIRYYKNFEELALKGSAELAPDDLLVHKQIGHNPLLAADTAEDVWAQGGARSIFSAAETFNIVSGDAADTAAGTGARMVKIVGLNGSHALQTETVTLNGTTDVETANSYLHIHKMEVILSGSGQTNAGAITATGTTSSNVMSSITAGEGRAHQTHFMVPAGYTCFITDVLYSTFRASGTGRKEAEFSLYSLSNTTNTKELIQKVGVASETVFQQSGAIKRQIPAKSLIWLSATAESANTAVSAQLDLVLVNEDLNFRTEI